MHIHNQLQLLLIQLHSQRSQHLRLYYRISCQWILYSRQGMHHCHHRSWRIRLLHCLWSHPQLPNQQYLLLLVHISPLLRYERQLRGSMRWFSTRFWLDLWWWQYYRRRWLQQCMPSWNILLMQQRRNAKCLWIIIQHNRNSTMGIKKIKFKFSIIRSWAISFLWQFQKYDLEHTFYHRSTL